MSAAYHARIGSISWPSLLRRYRCCPDVRDGRRCDEQASRTTAPRAGRASSHLAAMAALVAHRICRNPILVHGPRCPDAAAEPHLVTWRSARTLRWTQRRDEAGSMPKVPRPASLALRQSRLLRERTHRQKMSLAFWRSLENPCQPFEFTAKRRSVYASS